MRRRRAGPRGPCGLATFEREHQTLSSEAGALARPYAPKSQKTPRVSTPVPSSSAPARRMRATSDCAGRCGGAARSASYGAVAGEVARRRTKLAILVHQRGMSPFIAVQVAKSELIRDVHISASNGRRREETKGGARTAGRRRPWARSHSYSI